LGSRNIGESNRLFFLLTKDLGLVAATAQGVRELRSKLRYSLQDLKHVRLDLVRGKEMWRITNAECLRGHSFLRDKEKEALVARIALLMRRLIHGESKEPALFAIIHELMRFLEKEELGREDMHALEILTNLKVLSILGYGSEREMFRPFYLLPPSKDVLNRLLSVRREAVLEVNTALKESHL